VNPDQRINEAMSARIKGMIGELTVNLQMAACQIEELERQVQDLTQQLDQQSKDKKL
jgi:polyhydroxyalkanoate synthesis regulator phasin